MTKEISNQDALPASCSSVRIRKDWGLYIYTMEINEERPKSTHIHTHTHKGEFYTFIVWWGDEPGRRSIICRLWCFSAYESLFGPDYLSPSLRLLFPRKRKEKKNILLNSHLFEMMTPPQSVLGIITLCCDVAAHIKASKWSEFCADDLLTSGYM